MRVYALCESSGAVRDAFAARGHDAWSCDLEPCERGGKHYQMDCRELDYTGVDLVVAHPPCTYLANSGVSWLGRQPGRYDEMLKAAKLFRWMVELRVPHVAIENPIMHRYALVAIGRRYDQIIQPYQFGEDASKATCLWLSGLPNLVPTRFVPATHPGNGKLVWGNQTPSGQNKLGPSPTRQRERSRTYPGIAAAMAEQWHSPEPRTADGEGEEKNQ